MVLLAINGCAPLRRAIESHDDAHGRGLSRPVRAEETGNDTSLHLEIEIVDCEGVLVLLGEVVELEHGRSLRLVAGPTLFAKSGQCDVVWVELKSGRASQFTTKEVKDFGRDLEGGAAPLTGDVSMVAPCEVIRRRLVTIVRVVDDGEDLKFFEDAVHGGERGVGYLGLHGSRDFFDGAVVPGIEEGTNDGAFGLRYSFALST